MDALIYSPILSHPATAGNRQAVFHIGKYMQSAGYTVHFVYYTLEGLTKDQYDDMAREWDYFDVIVKSPNQPGPRTKGDLYAKDDWYQSDVGDFLAWKVAEFDIRLILFHYIFQSKALEMIPRYVRKILHTHDRLADRHRLFDLHRMDREFFYTTTEEEGAALRRADEIISVQAGEAKFFHDISGRPVHVLRQYFSPRFDNSCQSLRVNRVGYLASNNIINLQSIREFTKRYRDYQVYGLPFTLVIAGGICDVVGDLAGDNVEIMGRLERVEDFYKSVDLVINPMMFGTGLKIKSVEALSFGAAIVSTRSGMSGIVEAAHPYHTCESVDDVLQAVDLIIRQPTALAELRHEARRIFGLYYADTIAQLQKIFPTVDAMGTVAQLGREGLTLRANEFGSRGWYPAEEDSAGNTFRWLGPLPAAEISVKVPRQLPVSCRLVIINTMQSDLLRSIEIEVDGLLLETELETVDGPGLCRLRFIMPPSRKEPFASTRVLVKVAETIMPATLDPSSPDTRKLSIAVRDLTLQPITQ